MRFIKITKTASNSIVISKFNGTSYSPIEKLLPESHVQYITDSENINIAIRTINSSGTYYTFYAENIKELEVEPNPATPFEGTIEDLMDILLSDFFTGAGALGGGATEAKQDVANTHLSNIDSKSGSIDVKVGEIKDILDFDNWEYIPGNSKEFIFYPSSIPGSDIDNPSGSDKNIKNVIFKTGVAMILTQLFRYDINNNVISISAS